MSESLAYKWLKNSVLLPRDRVDRLENIVVSGMPDISVCIEGAEFWIEIKAPKEPKKESTPLFGSNHKFSQEQKNWFLRQRDAGGLAYGLIYSDKHIVLIGSATVETANEMTMRELIDVARWHSERPCGKFGAASMRMALGAR